tara:strand:- start:773 stop:880 length:108 start_codon:yes stop_codon:yes gene_type:complete
MLSKKDNISHFFLVTQNNTFDMERAEKPNIGIQNL